MKEKLLALQKKRAALAAQMRNLVDAVDSDTGMTGEQESQWNEMDKSINALDKSITAVESQITLEARLDEFDPVGRPSPVADAAGVSANATDQYLAAFEMAVRSANVSTDVRNQLVQVSNAMSVGVDTEGGFLLPESWASTLIKDLGDVVLMRQLGTAGATASTTNLPILDDKGAAGWLDEKASYPESDMSVSSMQIAAWKLGRIMKVSEELLQDESINLVAEIGAVFQETFGLAEDVAFFTGDGVKKPRGILLDAEVGVTSAANNAITYDEIVNLIYSVKESYRRNASMVSNDTTAGLLRRLKSADGVPMWQPSLQAGQPDRFLGYSFRTTDSMPAVGASAKPLSFGDFSRYRIADRGGMFMQRLNEKYADEGMVGFRMRKRVDGKLTRTAAVKTLAMPV